MKSISSIKYRKATAADVEAFPYEGQLRGVFTVTDADFGAAVPVHQVWATRASLNHNDGPEGWEIHAPEGFSFGDTHALVGGSYKEVRQDLINSGVQSCDCDGCQEILRDQFHDIVGRLDLDGSIDVDGVSISDRCGRGGIGNAETMVELEGFDENLFWVYARVSAEGLHCSWRDLYPEHISLARASDKPVPFELDSDLEDKLHEWLFQVLRGGSNGRVIWNEGGNFDEVLEDLHGKGPEEMLNQLLDFDPDNARTLPAPGDSETEGQVYYVDGLGFTVTLDHNQRRVEMSWDQAARPRFSPSGQGINWFDCRGLSLEQLSARVGAAAGFARLNGPARNGGKPRPHGEQVIVFAANTGWKVRSSHVRSVQSARTPEGLVNNLARALNWPAIIDQGCYSIDIKVYASSQDEQSWTSGQVILRISGKQALELAQAWGATKAA